MPGPLRRGDPQSVVVAGPALGLVECQSIARGITVSDAMVKRAAVALVLNRAASPGKHLSLCTGSVADVEEAMQAGRTQAGALLADELFLPQVDKELIATLCRPSPWLLTDALSIGIFETYSAASTLLGSDAACKVAEITIAMLRLCDGIGGKGFAVFVGEQDMVEAALQAAQGRVQSALLVCAELIPRPHLDMLSALLRQ